MPGYAVNECILLSHNGAAPDDMPNRSITHSSEISIFETSMSKLYPVPSALPAISSYQLIREYFASLGIFTSDDVEDMLLLVSERKLDKGDYFIREGEICREVAFILQGTLRSHFSSSKGEDITYCFRFPNSLLAAYSSFITGQPTEENIQAITPVELLIFSKRDIEALTAVNPRWVEFQKIVAEQQYIELENRIFQLQKNNALQRYAELLQNQPEYLQRIPLQYLASYLGITQRHLSRIRREVRF